MNATRLPRSSDCRPEWAPLDEEMVELPLLLPSWQAEALQAAAQDQGLTAGQMVRCLIQKLVNQQALMPQFSHAAGWDG